jgi:hypothetical protein
MTVQELIQAMEAGATMVKRGEGIYLYNPPRNIRQNVPASTFTELVAAPPAALKNRKNVWFFAQDSDAHLMEQLYTAARWAGLDPRTLDRLGGATLYLDALEAISLYRQHCPQALAIVELLNHPHWARFF